VDSVAIKEIGSSFHILVADESEKFARPKMIVQIILFYSFTRPKVIRQILLSRYKFTRPKVIRQIDPVSKTNSLFS
jgi:hypothetical protein